MTAKKRASSSSSAGTWGRIKQTWRVTKDWLDKPGMLPWIVNLLIAFVLIKFIIYPFLGWVLGTSLPIVAVVSGSMDHSLSQGSICGETPANYAGGLAAYWDTCGSWYERRGITKTEFAEYSFKNGFQKGDIMILLGTSRSSLKQGDVLVFAAAENYPIIHRVISLPTLNSPYYATKGDHNPAQIQDYVLRDSVGRVSRCHEQGVPAPCTAGSSLVTVDTPGAVALVDETRIAENQVIGKAVIRIPWLGWVKIWFTDLIGLFVK